MKYINDFINWLVISSEDPKNVSLTIKGIAIAALPSIVSLLNISGYSLDMSQFNTYFDTAINGITVVLTVVGNLVALFGLTRKVGNTIAGK